MPTFAVRITCRALSFHLSPAVWLLLAAVLVQGYYAAYYFLPFARRPPEPAAGLAGSGDEEPVSVLVCAHNELENLRQLLPLLLQQDYPAGFELILIDDRSDDDTYLFAQQLVQYYPHVRVVSVARTPPGLAPKKYALTLGIKTARYARLLLTDADCIPATNQWLRHMQHGFGQPADLVLGYSAYVAEPGLLNKLIRFETLLTGAQYLSFAWRGRPYMGVGRNLGYTKAVFQSTKGFASHIRTLSGDDDLLVQDAVAAGARAAVVAEPGRPHPQHSPLGQLGGVVAAETAASVGRQAVPAGRPAAPRACSWEPTLSVLWHWPSGCCFLAPIGYLWLSVCLVANRPCIGRSINSSTVGSKGSNCPPAWLPATRCRVFS